MWPILAQFAEVLVERAILLGEDNDVVDPVQARDQNGLRLRERGLRPGPSDQEDAGNTGEKRDALP